MSLDYYSTKSARDGAFRITKFDRDFEPEGSYLLRPIKGGKFSCECAAGHKPTCRHREMIQTFLSAKHVDDGFMLIWQTRKWHQPLNQDYEYSEDLDDKAAFDEPELSGPGRPTDRAPELLSREDLQAFSDLEEQFNSSDQAPAGSSQVPGLDGPEVVAEGEAPAASVPSPEPVSSPVPTSGNQPLAKTKDGLRRI